MNKAQWVFRWRGERLSWIFMENITWVVRFFRKKEWNYGQREKQKQRLNCGKRESKLEE